MGEGGMERSRRTPWLYQRVSFVKRRDCPTYALDVSLRSALRLRSAHLTASAPLRMTPRMKPQTLTRSPTPKLRVSLVLPRPHGARHAADPCLPRSIVSSSSFRSFSRAFRASLRMRLPLPPPTPNGRKRFPPSKRRIAPILRKRVALFLSAVRASRNGLPLEQDFPTPPCAQPWIRWIRSWATVFISPTASSFPMRRAWWSRLRRRKRYQRRQDPAASLRGVSSSRGKGACETSGDDDRLYLHRRKSEVRSQVVYRKPTLV